jgi:hypothetical protein
LACRGREVAMETRCPHIKKLPILKIKKKNYSNVEVNQGYRDF